MGPFVPGHAASCRAGPFRALSGPLVGEGHYGLLQMIRFVVDRIQPTARGNGPPYRLSELYSDLPMRMKLSD